MAFNRNPSATQPFHYISLHDPAVNTEGDAFDHEKYMATRDEVHCPLHPGSTPTKFVLKPLAADEFKRAVSVGGSRHEVAYELVAYSLQGVENFISSGNPVQVKCKTLNGVRRADKASLDAIYDPELFIELGGVVVTISKLNPLASSRSESK